MGLPQQLSSSWGDESTGWGHGVAQAGATDSIFGRPGLASHLTLFYLLSEIIVNNEYLRHGDHPWWPALISESYLWERIGRRPLTIHRTRSINTQRVRMSQTSCLAPLDEAQ